MTDPARIAEVNAKLQLVRQLMADRQLSSVVLTTRAPFSWITAGASNYINAASELGVASIVVTPDSVCCLCNRIEAPRIAEEELEPLNIPTHTFDWFDNADRARAFDQHAPSPRAVDAPVAPGLPLDPAFTRLRFELLPPELDRYRDVGQRTAAALNHVCTHPAFKPGISERSLAGMLADAVWQQGAMPWVTLIASDQRIHRYRHPIALDKPIDRIAMLVLCAERCGLICSATRIVSFAPLSDDHRRLHHACCRIDAAVNAATTPGQTLAQVFQTLQTAYAAEGHPDQWKLHHQGGPAGYLPREAIATPDAGLVIPPNAAFAWNPSITGTKSEDTLLVHTDASGTVHRSFITHSGPLWPMIPCPTPHGTFHRPDILLR